MALGAVIGAASCHAVSGLDDFSFDEAAGGGAGGSGGGAGGTSSVAGSGGGTSSTSTCTGDCGCGAGHVCVPYEGTGDLALVVASAGDCVDGWGDPVVYAPPQDPGCEPCGCAAPDGQCSATLNGYGTELCNEGVAATFTSPGCHAHAVSAFGLEQGAPSAGSCDPTGGGLATLDETTVCRLVDTPADDCGAGETCVPVAAGAVCVLLAEGTACPDGYGAPIDVARIVADTRDCTCSCGPPSDPTCGPPSATAYAAAGCTDEAWPVTDPTCTNTPNESVSVWFDVGDWSAGACATLPTSGSVTFGPTRTICCAP